MAYDKATVLEAWKKAVNYGIIDAKALRPEIARSWARCMSCGTSPWSADFPKCEEQLLNKTRQKNAQIIAAASPILQYLLAVFNCNSSLADMHGFVFDLVTPLSSYPRTLGTFVTEALNGNGNITITIQEKKPSRVDGYEHFRAISQSYSGVAALIHDPSGEDFVLCVNDPFSVLPPNALDICVAAASLVEKLRCSRRELFSQLSSATFFDPILESDSLAIIVTDENGMILTANSNGKRAVAGYEKQPYASCSLGDYLKNKRLLPMLLGEPQELMTDDTLAFKGSGRSPGLSMKLLRRRSINLATGARHNVLVFETPSEIRIPDESPSPLLRDGAHSSDCIGRSPQWLKVDKLIRSVAVHRSNVMIMGETGTGKEVAARALHRLSGRKGEFVAINCGALPRDLLASELFGYEGGAFTGARSSGAKGKFEYANEGTLFLDEIGDMPIDMQVSLLRVLQEQSVMRIGSNKAIPINVRVVAATNQDLQKLIAEGKFRSDLWYRLSVIEIFLPRLADREGDIPLLAQYFNETLGQSLHIQSHPLSQEVLDALEAYPWPGNVRELKNIMEKALIISNDRPITLDCFPEYILRYSKPKLQFPDYDYEEDERPEPLQPRTESDSPRTREAQPEQQPAGLKIREQQERKKIILILEEEHGNISRSAKRLGMSRNTLYRKMEKYDIQIKVKAVTD